MELIDCNDCGFCFPKERDQTKEKEPHMCKKYNLKLYHLCSWNPHDPFIFPCEKCIDDMIKSN
jgi:hypothetical protein